MVLSGRSAFRFAGGGDDVQSPRGSTGTEGVGRFWDIVKDSNPQQIYSYEGTSFEDIRRKRKQKMKRLLTGIELGDMLPSQLLRKMRALAGTDVSEKALRTHGWIKCQILLSAL
ncbi:hypothetical protein TNCV_1168541 [Trichonephila clavipes]|uniref:Uncharacterized protein n=1 Tax=Trichonephila clavipes TaxID=2585209 RepID=A0A8X6VT97_TRICX|nr:hypothetical protein TNCV_1168541 [Trichonephila clavipes]